MYGAIKKKNKQIKMKHTSHQRKRTAKCKIMYKSTIIQFRIDWIFIKIEIST